MRMQHRCRSWRVSARIGVVPREGNQAHSRHLTGGEASAWADLECGGSRCLHHMDAWDGRKLGGVYGGGIQKTSVSTAPGASHLGLGASGVMRAMCEMASPRLTSGAWVWPMTMPSFFAVIRLSLLPNGS
jgi:hypothetical protein